jgi:hypothetical protein
MHFAPLEGVFARLSEMLGTTGADTESWCVIPIGLGPAVGPFDTHEEAFAYMARHGMYGKPRRMIEGS